MPIAPAIPFGGLVGFRLLQRTYPQQLETFAASPDIDRETEYFLEKAGDVTSVDELLQDRRLLAVVLGAFGLDDDIGKTAFVRKVLEDGTLDSKAFANRLVEPAYRDMSKRLGFGDFGGMLIFEQTRLDIVARYRERQFELAVGEQDLDMRLALNFSREAKRIAADAGSDDTAWLRVLGSQPLRQVVEVAFNLPAEFGRIDLDRQLGEIRERARDILGSAAKETLADPSSIDTIVQRFLLNSQVRNGTTQAAMPAAVALTLLQSGPLGAEASQSLFASNFV